MHTIQSLRGPRLETHARPPLVARAPLVVTAAVALALAACAPGGAGVAGTVPPPVGSSEPSVQLSSDTPASASPAASPAASPTPSASGGQTAEPTEEPTAAPTATGVTTVRAYFDLPAVQGSQSSATTALVPVLRTGAHTTAVARMAMKGLLAGPNASEAAAGIQSAIPSGVTLLGLSIENGVATVDLSGDFSASAPTDVQVARVAQVVYTLTQFGNVSGVVFQIDGAAAQVPDDQGVLHDGAVGRALYRERVPDIFVDRPAWRALIGNPAHVTGLSRVFEATFRVRLVDAAGRTLADRQVMSTCGSGCWGTFDVSIPYSVGSSQWGTLRVYEPSAQDGSPVNVREEPVWLTPS